MTTTPENTPPLSPAELALPLADELVRNNYLDDFESVSNFEEHKLVLLEQRADVAGMLGRQYFVSAHRSLAIPVSFEAGAPVSTFDFNEGIDFSGKLITYSTVRLGRHLGGNAVRALCLTFDNVTLLPFFDKLPDDQLLYTPAFAVRGIDAIAS